MSAKNDSENGNRRSFLKKLTAGGAGFWLLGADRKSGHVRGFVENPDFTFVHLTDSHVRRARRGDDGYRRCVDHVNQLDPRPDFALMGGDGPFDGLYTEKKEFEDQIYLYKSITESLQMPWYHCIGNHDVLGWNERRKVPIDDPDLGKTMIMDRLGMEERYYSFDYGGWHFVVLDSIHPVEADHGPSYEARFGEEQLEWLRWDLGANYDKPSVVVTHIAAFCNIGQIESDPEMKAMHDRVCRDNRELREILERHKVKAVLQGHTHINEDYYYNGIWYITSKSVSAAWWGGNWIGFKPGYTVFSVKDEQLFWHRETFEWEHHLEPEDDLERERIREHQAFLEKQDRLRKKEINGPQ